MKTTHSLPIIVSLFFTGSFFMSCVGPNSEKASEHNKQLKYLEQVSYLDVKIDDNFWSPKIKRNRENGIRSVFKSAESSLENFDIASGRKKGSHNQMMAADSDIYKMIQGAAYALHHAPDKELEAFTDSVIDRIVAAQEDNGYLFTPFIVDNQDKRWTNIERHHELYCAGHLFEAAVAYYEVTGKRKLLDAATRFADHIDSVFGPGKRVEVPGHQEIELALYKLYKTTGKEKYLRLSQFFINERGNTERIDTVPPEFDPNAGTPRRWRHPSYRQDHLPVEKQFHADGHAVRATYMYSAMTDLAHETKSHRYVAALDSLWKDVVTKKMYVTAGIGTHESHDEGFGTPYYLPNKSAYCETCSGIGFTFWNRRMNRLFGDAKYADLLELLMYNAAISGVSLDGDEFFYRNPLESEGNYSRRPWFNPACCPSNMVRFLPEIGSTIYAKDNNKGIYVNQFLGNEASIRLDDKKINLKMETDYPWDGQVDIWVDPAEKESFKLYVRIPAWTTGQFLPGSDLYRFSDGSVGDQSNAIIKVNGEPIDKPDVNKGYVLIHREWGKGDRVELEFPMTPHAVFGHPKIGAAKGKVALMRGPVVYCMEEIDNPEWFNEAGEPKIQWNEITSEFDEDLLGGVVSIQSKASGSANHHLNVRFVPYYAWANRDDGKMKVWVPYE